MKEYIKAFLFILVIVLIYVSMHFSTPTPVTNLDETANSHPTKSLHALPAKQSSSSFSPETVAIDNKIRRFSEMEDKVLLNDEESNERKKILSNLETISWIENTLTKNNTLDLKERLSLIDFLQEAVIWNENPVRDEALTTIEKVIEDRNYLNLPLDQRNIIVGDKVELFGILTLESPNRAEIILKKSKDTKLSEILNYSVKRLSLHKKP
jgi:hypothetical protein